MSASRDRSNSWLPEGLYDALIDERLRALVAALPGALAQAKPVDPAESHVILAKHVAAVLEEHLLDFRGDKRLAEQIAVCNRLIELLGDQASSRVADPAMLLHAVKGLQPDGSVNEAALKRPATPLASSCLFTGTRVDPSLMSQIQRELASADRVDILCSFIKWSGIRAIEGPLTDFVNRAGTQLRIITTSYMGATDPRAVEFLAALPNTELRVSYDTRRTRLHAKAYIFSRNTGYGSAYVGSANLSNSAITDGLEWNVKISQAEPSHLWDKATGTFESYWNDPEFTSYGAADRERFVAAIDAENKRGTHGVQFQPDITPYGYQQEILDCLEAERELRGFWKNLVVAATGTGKTVIAALDYKRFVAKSGPGMRPRLLFIAHREEILQQSCSCFRAVLRDQNFGDLFVGEHRPSQFDHLFVSIQTWHSRELSTQFAPDYFDFVVVDEFHHAEASTYERLLRTIRPKILLGLTATPERADGQDILHHFDGRIAAEIRLPDAINRKLLSPFQYFGITDCVDLSALRWQRGGYLPSELDAQYTQNNSRADLVLRSVVDKLTDHSRARGLGFCVSVRHAEYMADYFTQHGIPSLALTGGSTPELRNTVQRSLVDRDTNFIFTVDLYNEGVDIPEVDTVLLLRPTESLTIFLQQLGRGLRLYEGKECLTVLDFIGQAHANYNFEARFRAIMDSPRGHIGDEIEDGCIHVPLGCLIQLERIAQKHVLDNIRGAIGSNKSRLVNRIRTFEAESGLSLSLANFLEYHRLTLDDIYKRASWNRLCAAAGVRPDFSNPDEGRLDNGLRRISHINGAEQIASLRALFDSVSSDPGRTDSLTPLDETRLRMAFCSLWGDLDLDPQDGMDRLLANPEMLEDLRGLLEFRYNKVKVVTRSAALPFACALELHARYTLDEILSAFGYLKFSSRRSVRQGVVHLPRLKADAFFVTLNKTDGAYSPTTMYEDYAISDTLFHWQSQSTTSDESETGRRYAAHQTMGYTPLLFVREDKNRDGLQCPYDFLGPLEYVSHTGSRPMSIIWRLKYPIPAQILTVTRRMLAS